MISQVEEIKSKLDIIELISKYVPSLKKRGRHWTGLCPFHNEKTPSFIVSPELQIFKCFGCGKGGDIFTFLEEFEKLDFKEVLQELAKKAGVVLHASASYNQEETTKNTLISINTKLAKFYNHLLTSHPVGTQALSYLMDRGISLATIKEFQLGFSPKDSTSSALYLIKQGFAKGDLIASGTFNASSYSSTPYDRFSSRLIFPLADSQGRILGFSGRILPGTDPQTHAKYINSPETPLYHKSHTVFGLHLAKETIRAKKFVIVTEGEFDMISPYQAGYKNIIAIKGTAFTKEQLQLLKRYTDTLILALDTDFAGSQASLRSITLAGELDFDIKVLRLGDVFKDPDEAIKSDPGFFQDQLQKAQPVWDFVIETQARLHDTFSPLGRKKFLDSTLPFIVSIKNEVIKRDYLQKIAFELSTDLSSVQEEAKKVIHPNTTPTQTARPISSQSAEKERELILLILSTKSPSSVHKKVAKSIPILKDPILDKLWQAMASYQDASSFQTDLAPELHPVFQELYLKSQSLELESEKKAQEIHSLALLIQVQNLKQDLSQLSKEIARSESHDEDTSSLEDQYNKLTKRLAKLQSIE